MASPETGTNADIAAPKRDLAYWMKFLFIRLGVLPFLLVIAIVIFTMQGASGRCIVLISSSSTSNSVGSIFFI